MAIIDTLAGAPNTEFLYNKYDMTLKVFCSTTIFFLIEGVIQRKISTNLKQKT